MHRRELTRFLQRGPASIYHFYLLHVGNFVRRVSHPGVQLACARRERETATRRAKMCKTARAPWETASVPGTPVNGRYMRYGVFVLTIDGRRTGAPHGTLLASPLAGSSMVHALSSQVLSPATSSWASPVHCACLRRAPSSDGRSDLCGNQNFTARSC